MQSVKIFKQTVNFGIIQTWQLYRLMKLNDLDYEVYNWHTTNY